MRRFEEAVETGKRKVQDARTEAERRLRSLIDDARAYDARRTADEVLYTVGEGVNQLGRVARNVSNAAYGVGERSMELERRLEDILADIDELRRGVVNFDKDRLIQGMRTAIRRSVTF
jgi:hypothetical protein